MACTIAFYRMSAWGMFTELQPWVGHQGPPAYSPRREAYDAAAAAENAKIDAANSAQNRGCKALDEGRYGDAKQQFLEEIRLDPGFCEGYKLLGDVYVCQQDYGKAMEEFLEASKKGLSKSRLKEALAYLHNHKGYDLLSNNNYSDAEKEFRLALQSRPKDAWTWNALGIALVNQNQLSEGEVAFQQAVKNDPNPNYKANLANCKNDLDAPRKDKGAVVGLEKSIQEVVQTEHTTGTRSEGGLDFNSFVSPQDKSQLKDAVADNPKSQSSKTVSGQIAVNISGVPVSSVHLGAAPANSKSPVDNNTAARQLTGLAAEVEVPLIGGTQPGVDTGGTKIGEDIKARNLSTPNASPDEAAYVQSRSLNLSGYPEKIQHDPTLNRMAKDYDVLQARQYKLESKRADLKQKLQASADNNQKQDIIGQISKCDQDSQVNLNEIYKKKVEITKKVITFSQEDFSDSTPPPKKTMDGTVAPSPSQ